MASRPPIVLDNGTGYTKLGYAGEVEPSALIPTYIATASGNRPASKDTGADDLDFYVGHDAMIPRTNYNVDYPIREGESRNPI